MALEGPQLRYVRDESEETPSSRRSEDTTDAVAKALRLARQVEELLEATPSLVDPHRAHSTRMARAMAASLVDELEAISKGSLKSGVA